MGDLLGCAVVGFAVIGAIVVGDMVGEQSDAQPGPSFGLLSRGRFWKVQPEFANISTELA